MWFELENRSSSAKSTLPEAPCNILRLVPFAVRPHLIFGRVALGATKSAELIVQNPSEEDKRVIVSKFPKPESGFSLDGTHFLVVGGGQTTITVSWTPLKEGNRRETMAFFVENNFGAHVLLIGEAYMPKRKRSRPVSSVLCPIQNTPIQRCPIRATLNDSGNRSLLVVHTEHKVDNTLKAASSTPTRSNCQPKFVHFGQLPNIMESDEGSCQYSRPNSVQSQSQNCRRETFLLSPRKTNLDDMATAKQETFVVLRCANGLPPCDVPSTPDRRNTYVKVPLDGDAKTVGLTQNEEFSEDSLEKKPADDEFKENLEIFVPVVDAGMSFMLSFKEAAELRRCSTQIKNKVVPVLECSVSPLVPPRKALFPPPVLRSVATDANRSLGCHPSASFRDVAVQVPAVSNKNLSVVDQISIPEIHSLMDPNCSAVPDVVVEDVSSVWWHQKLDVFGEWLHFFRQMGLHPSESRGPAPEKFENWLQSEYEDFVRLRSTVVIVQSVVRGFVQRRRYQRLRSAALIVQRRYQSTRLARQDRNDFLRRRKCAVMIQATFRMYRAKRAYRRDLTRVVQCQSVVRGFLQRRSLKRLQDIAVFIQRRYRALVAGQQVRRRFLLARSAAICIQSAYRRFAAHKAYLQDYSKVVKCQAVVRRHQQRRSYVRLKLATVTVQTRFRAAIIGRRDRVTFLRMHSAAKKIQAAFRAARQLNRYRLLKAAAVIIQQRFRSRLDGRVAREAFLRTRRAVVLIQSHYRRFRCRQAYVTDRECIVKCQALVRGFLERRRQARAAFAAVKIQRFYRAVVDRRRQRIEWRACVVLQASIRGWLAKKSCIRRLKQKNEAATIVQATWKAFLERKRFCRCRRAAVVIQLWFRAVQQRTLIHQQEASVLLQKRAEEAALAESARLHRAAVVIQAAWRGFHVRQHVGPQEMALVRDNLARANAAATVEQQLGNRTRNSMAFLLRCRGLSSVMRAFENLVVTTTLSRMSCVKLAESGALDTIVEVMKNRNRSMPNIDILLNGLESLINVAKCDETVDALFETKHLLATVLHLAVVYHEKAQGVFARCILLLWILAQDQTRAEAIRSHLCLVDKLQDIQTKMHRKQELAVQRQRNLQHGLGGSGARFSIPFHNLSTLKAQHPKIAGDGGRCTPQPDWITGRKNVTTRRADDGRLEAQLLSDPIYAIDKLVRLLVS